MSTKINIMEIKNKLENNTEFLVLETMEDLLKRPEFKDICTCNQCLLDIATYALNHLPAKYIASHEGEIRTKLTEFELQVKADVVSVVAKAIKVVSNNPHHDSH